jgi:branched-chain amino acid transport system permease protein
MLALLPQAIVDGVLTGAIYAIVAVGLTMVFGVMRIVNFAHGDFLMVGLYLTYIGAHWLKLDPYVASLFVVPLLTLLAAATFRVLIKPMLGRSEHNQVVATLGLSLILQNIALVAFSADFRTIPSFLAKSRFHVDGVIIRTPAAIACIASILLCLALYALLQRTDIGRRIRATAEDRDAALMCGVAADRMYLLAFCLGVGSLGLVAPLIAPIYYVAPSVGTSFTLTAFVVVVLGSLGNFVGALVGGLLIGVVEALGGLFTGGSLPLLVTYGVFILILLFRPTGLFGRAAL